MDLLFPQNPMMRKLPEPIFESEFDAAPSLGFKCLLFEAIKLVTEMADLHEPSIDAGIPPRQGQRQKTPAVRRGLKSENTKRDYG